MHTLPLQLHEGEQADDALTWLDLPVRATKDGLLAFGLATPRATAQALKGNIRFRNRTTMNVVHCNLPNLQDPFLSVDETHPEVGPVDTPGEQGMQADKDKLLMLPLRHLADAPLECEVPGEGILLIP